MRFIQRYMPFVAVVAAVITAHFTGHGFEVGGLGIALLGITATGNFAPSMPFWVDKNLLAVAEPHLQFNRYGQRRNLRERNGKQIKFVRYEKLATTENAPLVEGTAPAGASITKTEILATINQYGNVIYFSDLLKAVEVFPFIAKETELLGINMAETIDRVDSGILVGGTNVGYANGVTARSSIIQQFTEADIRIAVRALERKDAKYVEKQINATTGIGTQPIREAFVAIIHPDVRAMLDNPTNFPSFRSVQTYPHDDILKGEIGSIGNVRFVWSSLAPVLADAGGAKNNCISTSGTNLDVYQTIIVGEDAYGVTDLDGEGGRVIFKEVGSSGVNDPLDQKGSIGWKSDHTAEILNDNWMYRLETGALVNP